MQWTFIPCLGGALFAVAVTCCSTSKTEEPDFPVVSVSVWLTRCAARCISICNRNFTCEDLASLVHPGGKGIQLRISAGAQIPNSGGMVGNQEVYESAGADC